MPQRIPQAYSMRPTGFEPATSGLKDRRYLKHPEECSLPLSYGRTVSLSTARGAPLESAPSHTR